MSLFRECIDCMDELLINLFDSLRTSSNDAGQQVEANQLPDEDPASDIPAHFAYFPRGTLSPVEYPAQNRRIYGKSARLPLIGKSYPGPSQSDGEESYDEILSNMILHSPDEVSSWLLKDRLKMVRKEILKFVADSGVNIVLLPPGHSPYYVKIDGDILLRYGRKTPLGNSYENCSFYSEYHRIILFRKIMIGSCAFHEFAHAFDHAYSTRYYYNFRSCGLSRELWFRLAGERKGWISDYARTNPGEYFAESFEAYFDSENKERLKSVDPGMFEFLDSLLDPD